MTSHLSQPQHLKLIWTEGRKEGQDMPLHINCIPSSNFFLWCESKEWQIESDHLSVNHWHHTALSLLWMISAWVQYHLHIVRAGEPLSLDKFSHSHKPFLYNKVKFKRKISILSSQKPNGMLINENDYRMWFHDGVKLFSGRGNM